MDVIWKDMEGIARPIPTWAKPILEELDTGILLDEYVQHWFTPYVHTVTVLDAGSGWLDVRLRLHSELEGQDTGKLADGNGSTMNATPKAFRKAALAAYNDAVCSALTRRLPQHVWVSWVAE